jgi:hypothetical protein
MRDSANDAFFTAESLENLSEAVVREAIQNSLDAAERASGNIRQVHFRIHFVPSASPDVRRYLADLFAPARENFERGLSRSNLDNLFGDDCGYVVLEDFGTRGLTGDVEEWRLEHAEENAFFSFFRAEGRSGKTGEKLGRWGIGKQVFPTASRLHAMLGLTVRRESPDRVLMGSSVVRTHSVAGKDFQPDAWFGCREEGREIFADFDQERRHVSERAFYPDPNDGSSKHGVAASRDELVNDFFSIQRFNDLLAKAFGVQRFNALTFQRILGPPKPWRQPLIDRREEGRKILADFNQKRRHANGAEGSAT